MASAACLLTTLLVAFPAEAVAPSPQAAPMGVAGAPRQGPAPLDDTRREDESADTSDWYGAQTLLTDGLSLGFALGGASDGGEPLLAIAAGGYLLGAPIVHLAHENWWGAGASFGLRFGLPVLFVAVGTAIENCHADEDFCGFGSILIGGPLGILTAILLDAALLAREPVEAPRRVEPVVALRDDSLWLGARGAF